MKTYYNYTKIKLSTDGADTLVLKSISGSKIIITEIVDDYFIVDTTDYLPSDYYIQYIKDNEVIKTDKIKLLQNLMYAEDDFDPRSKYEIVIEAIDAMLQGRATAQQRRISVGDKSIEYSTLNELLSWREYFVKELRKEQNKTSTLDKEIAIMRRF